MEVGTPQPFVGKATSSPNSIKKGFNNLLQILDLFLSPLKKYFTKLRLIQHDEFLKLIHTCELSLY
jgi:hypothetical protein